MLPLLLRPSSRELGVVIVEVPDLDTYDELIEHKEVLNDQRPGPECGIYPECEDATRPLRTGFLFKEAATSYREEHGGGPGRASSDRELESLGVSERTDTLGVRGSKR